MFAIRAGFILAGIEYSLANADILVAPETSVAMMEAVRFLVIFGEAIRRITSQSSCCWCLTYIPIEWLTKSENALRLAHLG